MEKEARKKAATQAAEEGNSQPVDESLGFEESDVEEDCPYRGCMSTLDGMRVAMNQYCLH